MRLRGFWIKCLEKKIMKKKKICTEPGWATAQVSLRLGWALGWAQGAQAKLAARRHGAGSMGAGRAGAGRAGAGRAGSRALGAGRAGQAGAGGRLTLGRGAAGGRHGHVAGRHAGHGRRAVHGRLGGLGAAWVCSWANGLCTWCTQPVLTLFDSVFFLSH